ncbi:unnamed protein product [Microthlaspi erraticum]|uniref:Uncharacterized protein n=1 Tax=Microthlaspi erraticum TaxID=1685480 RepID=A0A6D2KS26_9BRAS|nr:unnamed protein product [Microthlaspi erraticum]
MKLCAESARSSGRRGPMNVSCCRAVMLQLVGEIGFRLPIDADPLCVEKCLDAPRWAPIVRVEMVRFGKTSNEGMWVETFVLKCAIYSLRGRSDQRSLGARTSGPGRLDGPLDLGRPIWRDAKPTSNKYQLRWMHKQKKYMGTNTDVYHLYDHRQSQEPPEISIE